LFPRKRESSLFCIAFGDDEKLIAGGSAPAPWVTFLCTRKEKSPKESAPGAHAALKKQERFPPFLAPPGARQLVGRTIRGSTQTGARLKTPGGAAVLGVRYGIKKNTRAMD